MFLINKIFKLFIGCEIHIKSIFSKIFSNKKLNIYDFSTPGVLPNFNLKFSKFIFLNCFIFNGSCYNLSIIERKLYFYYDIPKNYQLTQNFFQNNFNLFIKNNCKKKIIIKKIHFEEDAASSKEFLNNKKINYCRSGNALLEFVTEPLFNNHYCLINFIKKLKKKIFNNKISYLKMHLSECRVDINISILNLINLKKTKKIEIKNLNSIENIKNSIIYEYIRQIYFLEKKKIFFSQTRNFNKKNTCKIRKKCFTKNYNYHIDYDFGYLIYFDYEIFILKKKKKNILKKFPKKKFLLNKKNLYFLLNNYFFLKKILFNYNFLKKIKKNNKYLIYLEKKNNILLYKIKKNFNY